MNGLIKFLILSVPTIGFIACASNTNNFNGEKTPLGLFYGMSDWYAQKEAYQDSVFDNIPGIRHQEFCTDLCIPEDGIRCRNSLGIYIDEEYPSKAVREKVFAFTDSIICQGLSYYIEKDSLAHDLSHLETVEDFLNIWKAFYDKTGNVESDTLNLPEVRGIRVCVISHKVASKDNYATYLMESSVDYHSSCGCPSEADYITYDITSGKPLSFQEVLEQYPVTGLKKKIRDAYVKAAKEGNFNPSDYMTGERLLQEADGAAIINEGLLIFYKPYKIGCGAEGQYNLVIN